MTAKSSRLWGATLALAFVALATTSCGLSLQALPKPGGVSGPTYLIRAEFANVLNLPVQATVFVGANEVGDVQSITTSNYRAVLELAIRRSVRVPIGTTAQILFNTPLGNEFIELTYPPHATGGPWLHGGALLSQAHTSSAPSIADTLAALGGLLNGGGLNQLQTIIVQLNNALNGNQPQVRAILSDLTTTVTSLTGNLPSLDTALSGLSSLSTELAAGDSAIATGIDTIGPAIAVLNGENADFENLLEGVNQLATVADSVVTTSGANIVATVQQLNGVVNQLVNVEQSLGPTLSAFQRFEDLTPNIAPGNFLQLDLTGHVVIAPPSGASNGPTRATSPSPVNGASGSSSASAVRSLLGAGLP
ncbi:MAG TPA: MlaD family protein [Acidimicrobiales bacterium]|nr:MlaD family protein [Acidimicrobiales bacterium]